MTPSRNKRLRYARKKRQMAALLLHRLEQHEVSLVELLEGKDDGYSSLAPVRIHSLLKRTPSMGEDSTRRCLERADIYAMSRVGELSKLDVKRLVKTLPPRVKKTS